MYENDLDRSYNIKHQLLGLVLPFSSCSYESVHLKPVNLSYSLLGGINLLAQESLTSIAGCYKVHCFSLAALWWSISGWPITSQAKQLAVLAC